MKPTGRHNRQFGAVQAIFTLVSILSGLLLCTNLGLAEEHSPIAPSHLGGRLSFGHDENVIGASGVERDAFEAKDPDYLFVIDRMDDWRGEIELWARWDIPSFYKDLSVVLSYRRTEWANNAILDSDSYEVGLRHKLPDRSRLDLKIRHQPQVYLRHRIDKDAQPGEPRFRPEALRVTEIELAHSRPLGGLVTTFVVGYGNEDRTRWFNERDETTFGAGLEFDLPMGRETMLTPLYEYNDSRSRNQPDLGTDRSYHQHVGGLRLKAPWSLFQRDWRVELTTKWKFRSYATKNPQDESRYQRKDRIYYWGAKLSHPLRLLTPFVRAEGAGRFVDLPAGANATDEEGEYDDFVIQTGLEWEI